MIKSFGILSKGHYMTERRKFSSSRPLLCDCELDTQGKLLILEALLPYKADMIEQLQIAATDLICSGETFDTSLLVIALVERVISAHLNETENESVNLWASKLRLILNVENSFDELAGMAA